MSLDVANQNQVEVEVGALEIRFRGGRKTWGNGGCRGKTTNRGRHDSCIVFNGAVACMVESLHDPYIDVFAL